MKLGVLMEGGLRLLDEVVGLDATLVKVTDDFDQETSTANPSGTAHPIKVRRKRFQLADGAGGLAIESGRGVYIVATGALPAGVTVTTSDRFKVPRLAPGLSSEELIEQSDDIVAVQPVAGGYEIEVAS